MKFKVGDRVKSAAEPTRHFPATYHGVIHRVISNPKNSGGCYEVTGAWHDSKTIVHENWQAWGIHLESV